MNLEIQIRDDSIRLGQLLKLAGLVEGGGEVKFLLADEAVAVNGVVDTRRGKQIRPGDTVTVELPDGTATIGVSGSD